MNSVPRIGLAGFFIECNRWAPVAAADAFAEGFDVAGAALLDELRSPASRLLGESLGFRAAMDASGPWEPVPLRMAGAQPAGPVDHAFFESLCAEIDDRLAAAGRLDGVFLALHGAALTTLDDDPEATLLARIRARVGPRIPVVAVMDLHANLSARQCEALSALVAYRTNPHVDLFERGQEAAQLMRLMLRDGPGVCVGVHLPLVPPATAQLVGPGTVLAELIELAQREVDDEVLNVSLFGGFALSDAPRCGFHVVVTARSAAADRARSVAQRVAAAVWQARWRFVSQLTPLPEAVAAAVAAGEGRRPRLMLADVADNPGAGGGGNTTVLLRSLVEAGARQVVLGVFTDASLAREAHAAGVGATFEARFNRAGAPDDLAQPWSHAATVLSLSDGVFVGRQGLVRGTRREMGAAALLQVGGVQVAVVSVRQQLLDPAQLEVLGVDLDAARVLVAKSRGHFRAAFEGFAAPADILEVDGPGLTTPNLRTLPFRRLPRPVFAIDEDATWPPLPT